MYVPSGCVTAEYKKNKPGVASILKANVLSLKAVFQAAKIC